MKINYLVLLNIKRKIKAMNVCLIISQTVALIFTLCLLGTSFFLVSNYSATEINEFNHRNISLSNITNTTNIYDVVWYPRTIIASNVIFIITIFILVIILYQVLEATHNRIRDVQYIGTKMYFLALFVFVGAILSAIVFGRNCYFGNPKCSEIKSPLYIINLFQLILGFICVPWCISKDLEHRIIHYECTTDHHYSDDVKININQNITYLHAPPQNYLIFSTVENLKKYNLSEACAICLQDYKTSDNIKLLKCSHYFHMACVNNLVICPVCRSSIS